jgi:hypothetical protein
MAEEDATRAILEELEEHCFFHWGDVSRSPSMSLIEKFDFVNTWPNVQPLGLNVFAPNEPYEIYSLEKSDHSMICVQWVATVFPTYFLPPVYARMVSRRDIAVVNSGLRRFALAKTHKEPNHLTPFPEFHSAWNLVLSEIPRDV